MDEATDQPSEGGGAAEPEAPASAFELEAAARAAAADVPGGPEVEASSRSDLSPIETALESSPALSRPAASHQVTSAGPGAIPLAREGIPPDAGPPAPQLPVDPADVPGAIGGGDNAVPGRYGPYGPTSGYGASGGDVPTTGYGASGGFGSYGAPVGYPSYGASGGYGSYGAPGGPGAPAGPFGYGYPSAPSAPDRKRKGWIAVALVAAAALVVASASAGISAVLSSRQGSSTSPPTSAVGRSSSGTTAAVAAAVDPAVVDVDTVVELASGVGEAAGTGMIVTADGTIITNNHVVEGARSIKVTIEHRGTFKATVVGTDSPADVAVLQVHGLSGLPIVRFGDSSAVTVGTDVVAIGNALGLGGNPTVTSGTVTALDRSITASDANGASEHLSDMLQTDAQIQPGNSGGPLLTSSGKVIGMNTAATSASSDSPTSLGFAIPASRVIAAAEAIESGRAGNGVVIGLPAFLGIDGQTMDAVSGPHAGQPAGAEIIYVEPNSPAASIGIVPGDVIVAFAGKATPTIEDLANQIHAKLPGQRATVTFESSSGKKTVSVRLATGPAA